MTDREVSMGCVVAYGLWALVVLLLGAGLLLDHAAVSRIGLATSAAAATATIRQYLVAQNRMIRNAFELGRDSVRPVR